VVAAVLLLPVTIRVLAREREGDKGGFAELRDGFVYSYRQPRLRFYILLGTSVWLMFGTFSTLEPLFFRDILEVEVEALGWVNSIFGLGLVGGTMLAARLPARLRSARTLTLVVGLNGVGTLLYVGTDRLPVVVAAGVVWGLIIGTMAPLHRTLIQLNSPDEMIGRITGVTHVHSEVGHLIPLLIAPALAGAFGVQPSLLYSGFAVMLIAMLAFPIAARLDRTREVEVPATGLPDPTDEPKSVGH
jgi:predicted MFS family arabinose efflux permease